MVEHPLGKGEVPGSNPGVGTIYGIHGMARLACSSAVELPVYIRLVGGSIPSGPTEPFLDVLTARGWPWRPSLNVPSSQYGRL